MIHNNYNCQSQKQLISKYEDNLLEQWTYDYKFVASNNQIELLTYDENCDYCGVRINGNMKRISKWFLMRLWEIGERK